MPIAAGLGTGLLGAYVGASLADDSDAYQEGYQDGIIYIFITKHRI